MERVSASSSLYGKTGLNGADWKSLREVGIREKVWAAQEIGMGSYVRARHA
jgi:hypothetical protein